MLTIANYLIGKFKKKDKINHQSLEVRPHWNFKNYNWLKLNPLLQIIISNLEILQVIKTLLTPPMINALKKMKILIIMTH